MDCVERMSIVCYFRENMKELGSWEYETLRRDFVEARRLNQDHPEWRPLWNGVSPNMWESKEWYKFIEGMPDKDGKDMLDDVVNPVDTVIEIDDDEDIKKALRPEITKEQLGMVIEHLMEAIEGMIEMPEEEEEGEEMEGEEMEAPENPAPVGDPMKNEVNWPVTKAYENCGCETCKAKNISCTSTLHKSMTIVQLLWRMCRNG